MPFTIEERKARAVARKAARAAARDQAQIDAERSQRAVRDITINIEWVKSRMWGANPRASARVIYQDGTTDYREGYTCSGYGYDKESTVIAEIFNAFLKYKLYEKRKPVKECRIHGKRTKKGYWLNGECVGHPYGITYYGGETKPYKGRDGKVYIDRPAYNGGVGTSSYYDIAEFIGGKFECLAGGKSFDVYKYSEPQEPQGEE